MPDPRDPRVDPIPGDVVRKETFSALITRRVTKVIGGGAIQIRYASGEKENCIFLSTWRQWCKGAEITERGSSND